MKKLYIIGNGFDCYAHGLKTKYSDFRDFIINKYNINESKINDSSFPPDCRSKPTKDHWDYEYSVISIVRLLDTCEGEFWSDIEKTIGKEDFYEELWENEMMSAVTFIEDHPGLPLVYGQMAYSLANTVPLLRELFEEWVAESLNGISYHTISPRKEFLDILDTNCAKQNIYIVFNYTYTLEEVYGIPKESVYHIHGSAGEDTKKVIFGHSNNQILELESGEFDAAINIIRSSLLKDTDRVIEENLSLFSKLYDVSEVYSYGFSFSEVDMPYVHEITKQLVPSNVTWFFNSFAWQNNKPIVERIRALGYRVDQEKRW